MEKLENKLIDLILNRCLNFDQSKSLMIHCDFKEHIYFAEKVKLAANKLGIYDVCIHVNDLDEVHEYLRNTNTEEIKNNKIIDRTDWNDYSKKGAALLFLNSTIPGLMDDIEPEKIKKLIEVREETIKYYRKHVTLYDFPWCIIALPNERWAKTIFKDDKNAYEKLYLYIMKVCMVDKENPTKAWGEHIEKNNYYKNKLNELKIKSLHYTNSLGTDLVVGLPERIQWLNLDKTDAKGGQMIANMPSYEIFTTPDFRKTNGIVYSSRPLIYNGCYIDKFYIKFKDGIAVSCGAQTGQKQLEELLFENEGANRLGEVALVPYDSPISNTGLVFNTTLLDENASCHFAVGDSYKKTLLDMDGLSDDELIKRGFNISKTHVDFMIGTNDLQIEAETKEGKKLIFKNGNFNI